MFASDFFIEYSKSRLRYRKGGHGPVALLAFHGFGQDGSVFGDWLPVVAEKFTVYAFDLFYHGKSEWKEGRPVEKSDWTAMVSLFLEKEKIHEFAVAGYSLGGKFELATLEAFPEKTRELFFVAPDGVKINFWYKLATGSAVFRALFRSMIKHPGRFQDIVGFLRSAGVVHKGILRFAESQMNTEEKRRRVYDAWVDFRRLQFDIRKLAAMINEHSIAVTFISGRYDKMIPPEMMDNFASMLREKKVIVLEAGHNEVVRGCAGIVGVNYIPAIDNKVL